MATSQSASKKPLPDNIRVIIECHRSWLETRNSESVLGRKAILAGQDLSGVELKDIDLSEADLGNANLSDSLIVNVNFKNAILNGTNFSGSTFSSVGFTNCHFSSTNLSKAFLYGADLSYSKIDGHTNFTDANLSCADLNNTIIYSANMSGANLNLADLTGASISYSNFSNCDLRGTKGLRLDYCNIREAQFTPVASRWWAHLSNRIIRPLHLWLDRIGRRKAARYLDFPYTYNDPWSVLRQIYSGPRVLFLFFFVVLFTLPYLSRAILLSTVSSVEQRAIDSWAQGKGHWPNAHSAIARPGADAIPTPFEKPEDWIRAHSHPKPLWMILLKWDRGVVWPSALAVLLIIYNIGIYCLITSVGPLRDEEERSGWSPEWKEYSYLTWIHRMVTILFYVSFASFLWNSYELLNETVWIPIQ